MYYYFSNLNAETFPQTEEDFFARNTLLLELGIERAPRFDFNSHGTTKVKACFRGKKRLTNEELEFFALDPVPFLMQD